MHTARSNLASATGNEVASPWRSVTFPWPPRRQGEHGRAGIDAYDRAGWANLLLQFRAQEAGAASHIQDVLARRDGQGGANQGTSSDHIADAVESLQLLASLHVKHGLGHAVSLARSPSRADWKAPTSAQAPPA
jgi:hypothetical protein